MLDMKAAMAGKYGKEDRACPHCPQGRERGVEERPAHWIQCDPYSVPLVGVDPDYGIDDWAKYLVKIIERRETRKVIITRSYDRMAPLGQVLRHGR